MGIGAWFKAAIIAGVIIVLLGFATSSTLHEAVWDGVNEFADIEGIIEELDDIDSMPFSMFPEQTALNLGITAAAAGSDGPLSVR